MIFAFLWLTSLSIMVSKVHPYWVATILKYCCWLFDQCPDDRAFLTDNKDKPGERGFSGIFQKGQIVTALWGSALWGVLQEPGRTGIDESESGEWKSWLKAQHSGNEDHGIWPYLFMGNRWEYQTTWPAFWETDMQVRKQQLELDMEQQTGSK